MASDLGYATLSSRIIAQIVDLVAISIVVLLIASTIPLLFYVIDVVVIFLYFTAMEGTSGATLGKKAMKIRVANEDGSPCTMNAAITRNLLRFVDALPFAYIVGMYLISRSDNKQRLGDRIAKTIVIKEAGPSARVGVAAEIPYGTGPQPTAAPARTCPDCGGELSWIEQYNEWYCYNCQKYP